MTNTEKIININQNKPCFLAKENIFEISHKKEETQMQEYQVFPGIKLIYNDVHRHKSTINQTEFKDVLEIHHCREGRIECAFSHDFFYLTPGDLSITRKNHSGEDAFFPLGHYHGLTIVIDLEAAPKCLSCFLDDVNVSPKALVKKYCGDNKCTVVRSKPCLEHIFSELYAVPDSIRLGYFKVKILELLLFLSSMDMEEKQETNRYFTASQVVLAKKVGNFLAKHMEERITIEELSKIFHVSQTALKNSFKGVYGVSVYTYIKEQKMHAAARLLRSTDEPIVEVAGKFGYDNPSKFAVAFRTVLHCAPNEYRALKKEEFHYDAL